MATPSPVSLTGSAMIASSPASSRSRMTKNKRIAASASLPLPGLSEPLWARGEVIYDRVDGLFHGQAIRFVAGLGIW